MESLFKKLLLILACFGCLNLVGCASTYHSHVITVNQLPENLTQKSYQFAANQDNADTPEMQHAFDEVRSRLHELGFSEVNENANLSIKLRLSTRNGDMEIWSPYGSIHYFATPYGTYIPVSGLMAPRYSPIYTRLPLRRPLGFWYDPFYWGRFPSLYSSSYTVRQYFKHELGIDILDQAANKILYQVTARSERTSPEIDEQIPFLVESALRDFPNKTGKAWVQLKIEK